MRGSDHQQADLYSYLAPEQRVRANHPLRAIRAMADEALQDMSKRFDAMYAKTGRPSIPPKKLLRAQLIQMLYSIRSERLLMEEIDYSMLFRWFVGMNLDEPVWDVTVFTGGKEAKLSYNGNLLTENRNGLIVNGTVSGQRHSGTGCGSDPARADSRHGPASDTGACAHRSLLAGG
jgi:hypothetical protein